MTALLRRPLLRARRFWDDTRASLSVEAAIILPILCGLYVAGYQYFDSYRRETQIFKATAAVADLLSRQPGVVSPVDLDGLKNVFEKLIFAEDMSFMRFTEISRRTSGIETIWSWATDGQPEMTTARLQGYLNKLPPLVEGERVVVVESYTYDSPFFAVGLKDRIIPNFTTTKPRYGGCIAFTPDITAPSEGCLITGGGTVVAPGSATAADPHFEG